MRKWLRNRKRWAARRALILQARDILDAQDTLAALRGRRGVLEAAIEVRMQIFCDLWNERVHTLKQQRERGDALLLAQIGMLS